MFPIYRYAHRVDNCVFDSETVWEGRRAEGETFHYHPGKPHGFNFIREATDLHGIADRSYDFVLSSHSLEHLANPIKALREWVRVTRPDALFIIIVPHYRYTFDHRRTPTTIQHMLDDYERKVDETDQTHLQEILRLHDLSLDEAAGDSEQFRLRSMHNIANRCLHHHVFDEHNSRELAEVAGLRVDIVQFLKPHNIVIIARANLTGDRKNVFERPRFQQGANRETSSNPNQFFGGASTVLAPTC